MAEVFGVVSGIVGTVNTLITRVEGLHERWKIFKNNPQRWETLKETRSTVLENFNNIKSHLLDSTETCLSVSGELFKFEIEPQKKLLPTPRRL